MAAENKQQNDNQIKRKRKTRKKQTPTLWGSALAYKLVFSALIIGFLIGIGIMLHPFAQRLLFEFNSAQLAGKYEKTANASVLSEDEAAALEAEFERALAYNRQHSENIIEDPFSEEWKSPETVEEYNSLVDPLGNGMMGVLEIPRIGQRLCIYHGTDEQTLLLGAGHISGSSLPVGGESTHSVLTGHRGLAAATLFTDLDLMREGDKFYIHVLGHDLAYEVDQILTVLPTEISALDIIPGGDYVTLVTCTPYAVNSHRLLVRGRRVAYEKKEIKTMPVADTLRWLTPTRLVVICIIVGIAVVVFIFLILLVRRRRAEEDDTDFEDEQ